MKNMGHKVHKELGSQIVEKDQSELLKILGKEHYLNYTHSHKYISPARQLRIAATIPETVEPTVAEQDLALLKGIMPPKYHTSLQK
jgi:thermostable 8-oxoguanine DNA glycosylase